jgi:hypothetical protein
MKAMDAVLGVGAALFIGSIVFGNRQASAAGTEGLVYKDDKFALVRGNPEFGAWGGGYTGNFINDSTIEALKTEGYSITEMIPFGTSGSPDMWVNMIKWG